MDSPHHVPLPKSFESSRTVPRLEIPCSDPTYSTVTLVEEQSRSSVQESEKQAQAIPNSRRLLRVIIIESTILVLALATLSLASAYGTQLYKAPRITDLVPSRFVMPGQVSPPISRAPLSRRAPIASYYRNTSERLTANDTQSWVIFYSGTMPLLSIIMTTVGIILAYRKKVTPLYSTILSAAFLASWCVNVGWWITCDWASTLPGGNTAPKTCLQTRLIQANGGFIGIDTALMNAKICFGILTVIAYAIYLSASIFFPMSFIMRSKGTGHA